MIEYIEIENYQSHTKTRIDLSEGITAITGLSMSGKTAIKRAFEWLRKNRPLGFRFNYRYANDPTKVEIGVDGHVITAIKSSKALDEEGNKALYSILYPDGKKETFTAIGTDVPEKVTELLGVSDISIQDQLDAYLLVISSSGEIARTINRITGIDIADKWIKEIGQCQGEIKRESSRLEGEVGFLESDLEKYTGIDDLYKEIQAALLLESEYQNLIRENNLIVDSINQFQASLRERENISEELSPLDEVLIDFDDIKIEIQGVEEEIRDIKSAILLGENKERIENSISPFLSELESVETILSIKEERTGLLLEIRRYQNAERERNQKSKDLENYLSDLRTALLNQRTCSECGSPLTEARVRSILENI